MTTMIQVDRPVGARTDVSELEYISALMQTERFFLRQDGSLTTRDIHFYLKSRHGVVIPEAQIEEEIVMQLGGTLIASASAASADEETAVETKESPTTEEEEEEKEKEESPRSPPRKELHRQRASLHVVTLARITEQVKQSDVDKFHEYENLGVENRDPTTEKKLDLAQITSLLLIPTLRRIRHESDHQSTTAQQDDDVIEQVLTILLRECNLTMDQEINYQVLQRISTVLQQVIPQEALDPMLQSAKEAAATGSDDGAVPRLNRDFFLSVLTQDLDAYDINIEESTHDSAFQEVMASSNSTDDCRPLERIYTAGNVDSNADTYKSIIWQIVAWYVIVVAMFTYLFKGANPVYTYSSELNCTVGEDVGCSVAFACLQWIELLVRLGIIGFPFLMLATLGNTVYLDRQTDTWKGTGLIAIGIASVVLYVVVPYSCEGVDYLLFYNVDEGDCEETTNREIMGSFSLALGIVLFCIQFYQISLFHLPNRLWPFDSWPTKHAKYMKQAANYKMNKMIQNALECHLHGDNMSSDQGQQQFTTSTNPNLGQAIVKYQQTSLTRTEKIGGIAWTFKKVWDGTLYNEEGIWLFPRLIAANSAQFFVVVILVGFYIDQCISLASDEQQQWSFVTNKQLLIALSIGFPPALIAAISISLIYIPSAVTSVLKYRSGLNGSLRDRIFSKNRSSMDTTNYLFGSAFWCCIGSAGLIFALITGFVILCFYEPTKSTMVFIVANFVGMLVSFMLKQILVRFIRSYWFRGYYRSRPAAVNITNAIQECWALATTTFLFTLRAIKMLFILVFYLGRIDIQIYSPGVGWLFGAIPLDSLPYAFHRDLMQHEAHRHPLIEQLGLLYLLKLRHGHSFGTPGCAQWRLLFTCCLMPWLTKYRKSLGICGQNKPSDKEKKTKSSLMDMSKEKLADRVVVVEKQYMALAEKLRALGHEISSHEDMNNSTTNNEGASEGTNSNNDAMNTPFGGRMQTNMDEHPQQQVEREEKTSAKHDIEDENSATKSNHEKRHPNDRPETVWREHTDAESGCKYYTDAAGNTTWDKPTRGRVVK